MKTIKQVLMERDEMTQQEAEEQIKMAKEDLHERLAAGEMPHDICAEWFSLEPDYIWDLM